MRSVIIGLLVGAVLVLSPPRTWGVESCWDPIERVNRGVFWFNDKLDVYILEPTARGWNWLMPNPVQQAIARFFDNVRFPVVAVNNLLQGKLAACGSDVGRFAVNTTVGVLGFMDPASGWGLEKHDEDFGQTLGVWGVPFGPYLVLPLLGPSNPRDVGGAVADSFATVYPWLVPIYYTIGPKAVDTVNWRSQMLDEVREAKQASVDYYVFVRDAYAQRRHRQVEDTTEMTEEEQQDLYYFDEERQ
jgi:phospholipid-binding lipoprotein MlaA